MAKPKIIGQAAAENGMSERDFLAHMLAIHKTAKGIAAALEISGAAVSFALERNGFKLRSEWVQDAVPELESA